MQTHLKLCVRTLGRSLCFSRWEVEPKRRWCSTGWIWRSWLGHDPDLEVNTHLHAQANGKGRTTRRTLWLAWVRPWTQQRNPRQPDPSRFMQQTFPRPIYLSNLHTVSCRSDAKLKQNRKNTKQAKIPNVYLAVCGVRQQIKHPIN